MRESVVTDFIRHHFRHFNAAVLREAAEAFKRHLDSNGKMLITLAGAMSTAEIGLSLAEMIRQGKIHAVSCTGANLEEDLFNLIAHNQYEAVPSYRHLTSENERRLFERKMNRVTDTCIPDTLVWERLEKPFMDVWTAADRAQKRHFSHEFCFQVLSGGRLEQYYQIDPKESWLLAAMERNVPIFVPGWEDSSLGNMYAAACFRKDIQNVATVRSGTETMLELLSWYSNIGRTSSLGFFQIGGGIAGDFPICVVPTLRDDLLRSDIPKWSYFCQVSDSTTSYGSYSGATPNEKISWGKLEITTPSYIIESDATIVVPLIFAYVLNW